MESLTADWPAAMVTEVWPSKVTALSVPVFTDEPELRCATCTFCTVSGAVPKTLEIRTWAEVPPMLVCTICRSVWLAYEGPPLCGDTDQLPFQPSATGVAAGTAGGLPAGGLPSADAQGMGIRANVPMASAAAARTASRLMERACRRKGVILRWGEEDAWTVLRPQGPRQSPCRRNSSDDCAEVHPSGFPL